MLIAQGSCLAWPAADICSGRHREYHSMCRHAFQFGGVSRQFTGTTYIDNVLRGAASAEQRFSGTTSQPSFV
eukprot:1899357-Lingulodinium_polyedra.AAC.1